MSSLKKHLLEISFDGTDYFGWQRQPDQITVQETIEKRLSSLYGHIPVSLNAASRTDAGVHAYGLLATVKLPPNPHLPKEKVLPALNHQLPSSIQIKSMQAVSDKFDSREAVISKTYTYVFQKKKPTPFQARYCYFPGENFDFTRVKNTLPLFQGAHDFSAFTILKELKESPEKTIFQTTFEESDESVKISFKGSGFLYKMVRLMVGTLIEVGKGNLSGDDIKFMLKSGKRPQTIQTAPPQALFLMHTQLEDDSPCR